MTQRRAAIDIGTNSVRLLIADCDANGATTPVDRRVVITRLGEGVHATRSLQPEPMRRTLAALADFGDALRTSGVTTTRVVSTSATRDAENRDEFFAAVADAIGVRPELLSGVEEAALSFRGATMAYADAASTAPFLVVDIGGGSTELIVGSRQPEQSVSLDVGCVRITEAFLESDPPAPEELSNAIGVVRDALNDADRVIPLARDAQTVLGVAGTIASVAMIEQGLVQYSRERVHGFVLTRAAVEDVFRTLATETAAERAHNPGLEPERVGVIVGGLIVLVAVMRHFDLPAITCSESDLLDGCLMEVHPSGLGVEK